MKKPSTYIFNISGSPQEKIEFIEGNGFGGVMLTGNLDLLRQYVNVPMIKSGAFSLSVVYFHINIENDINANFVRTRLELIKDKGTVFSVIARGNNSSPRNKVLQRFRVLADLCQEYNKDLVIYPHDKTFIESAEEALSWINDIDKPNVSLSFHLAHELRHNNAGRMVEVIQNTAPYISYVSISGGDSIPAPRDRDWSDVIKPLDQGTFDTKLVFDELKNVGFNGPIVFHTFGIQELPSEHLPRSLDVLDNYREEECETITNVIEEFTETEFGVFPNPSETGVFTLNQSSKWKVYSIQGELLMNGNTEKISLKSFNRGVYLLKTEGRIQRLVYR